FKILFQIMSTVEFTNFKCTSLNKQFTDFEYCYLKSVNRSYKYLSLKVNLFKIPITKVSVNFAFLKRTNGYKPFLYNVTADACKFLKNEKSNPVLIYMYNIFRSHSNMNHTCPYNHDLILDKISNDYMNNHLTNVLPFPDGEYLLNTHWFAYGIKRAIVSIYLTLKH
ncbi:hypothetical protein KR018_003382, partial [Drosophila ironensis]